MACHEYTPTRIALVNRTTRSPADGRARCSSSTRRWIGTNWNHWTTPIGSVVFAIAPGCAAGGHLGEGLLA